MKRRSRSSIRDSRKKIVSWLEESEKDLSNDVRRREEIETSENETLEHYARETLLELKENLSSGSRQKKKRVLSNYTN